MSELSGLLGMVNGEKTVRNWRISETASLPPYAASNTHGIVGHVRANRDWSGSFELYGDLPAVLPAENFTFLGSIDGAKGVSGPAIVDEVVINYDIEGGAPVSCTVNFSGNGALLVNQTAALSDTDLPTIYAGIDTSLELATMGASDWNTAAAPAHLRTMSLTLSASNVSYASSDTEGWIKRKRGNITVSFSYSVYAEDEELANYVAANTLCKVELFSNAARSWILEGCLMESISDVVVDIEGPAMVGFTQAGKFCAHFLKNSTWTEGEIIAPDASTYWPPA